MRNETFTKNIYGLNITVNQGMQKESIDELKKALFLINYIGNRAEQKGVLISNEAKEKGLSPKVHLKLNDNITLYTNYEFDEKTKKTNCKLEFLEKHDGEREIINNITPEYLKNKIIPYLSAKTIEGYVDRIKQHIERVNDSVGNIDHNKINLYVQQQSAR